MILDKEEKDKMPNDPFSLEMESAYFLQLKVVYWGPGESGKTTNFNQLIHSGKFSRLNPGISIETTDGRTLWEDSVYIYFKTRLQKKDFVIIVQINTCTGQERFLSTREYVLSGADGVIFVADSNPNKLEQNKRSYREFLAFTSGHNIPYVIQLNKRDLNDAISIQSFKKHLNLPPDEHYHDGSLVVYPAIAINREGVIEPFETIIFQVLLTNFYY